MKSAQPIAGLATQLVRRGAVPEALARFIGVSERAGALGLILPAATRGKPWLTLLAEALVAELRKRDATPATPALQQQRDNDAK